MLKLLFKKSISGIRESNQDSFLYKELQGDILVGVADGMGGGVMGKELSKKALEILDNLFIEPTHYPLPKLKEAVFEINDRLKELLNNQKGGTTLSAIYYKEGLLYYITIGDSRVWVCSEDRVIFLTKDQNLYEYNKLNRHQTSKDDKRLVYRILGISSNKEIEDILSNREWLATGVYETKKDDIILLSTDGFHDYVLDNKVCNSLESSFEYATYISNDNITLIALKEQF